MDKISKIYNQKPSIWMKADPQPCYSWNYGPKSWLGHVNLSMVKSGCGTKEMPENARNEKTDKISKTANF